MVLNLSPLPLLVPVVGDRSVSVQVGAGSVNA